MADNAESKRKEKKKSKESRAVPFATDWVSRWLLLKTDLGTHIVEATLPDLGPFESRQIQKVTADGNIFSKEAIFDFYCDNEKAVVDLEMQSFAQPDINERAAFYLTSLGGEALKKGEGYFQKKKAYVIFYLFSGFPGRKDELALRVYSPEQEQRFGLQIIYINGQYENPNDKSELALTVHDMQMGSQGDIRHCRKWMRKVIDYYHRKGGHAMGLKIWQDQIEGCEAMAAAEGKAEGAQKNREDTLRFMVNSPDASDALIANYLGIPVSEVPSIREKYKNK